MYILILGAPGSGKGTQGNILAERLGLPKITTGDLIRTAMQEGTPLGVAAKKYYDDGKLVPDSVILSLIKDQLAHPEAKEGAILDGFPRTIAHYTQCGIVHRVPGTGTVDQISEDIKRIIGR